MDKSTDLNMLGEGNTLNNLMNSWLIRVNTEVVNEESISRYTRGFVQDCRHHYFVHFSGPRT